jgi:Asp-tRNA(Asn)/Glu-tRNA(Gln) amidotransferase A subunit family amidase
MQTIERTQQMTEPSLLDLTASQARDRMARGDITAEAYVSACLGRIAEREKDVQAWVHLDRDGALAQARAADKRRAAGQGLGALHGLPVGIKDIIDVEGLPTENGSPVFRGNHPGKDAGCVAALRTAGAVIMGKTVTTQMASSPPSRTRNPRHLAHSPGGSSSGSAAAVADRMVPLALGTQTGGSVIRPGSFNGIHALKPTLGLISRTGVTLQSHTLDTVGVYGRSVADLALITDTLSRHDPDDPVSFAGTRPGLSTMLGEGNALKPRLLFLRSPAWSEAEPDAREAILDLVRRLGRDIEEVEMPAMRDIIRHHGVVMGAENAHYYGPLMRQHPDGFERQLIERVEAGARVMGHDYVSALVARDAINAEIERVLAGYAVLVTLSAPGPAPKGFATTGNPVFNGLWTLLGVPCVSLPLMQVGGLPLGLQLVGKRRDEGRALRAAQWLENRLGSRRD